MTTFRTTWVTKPSGTRISLADRILTVGSCFSDAIGSRFTANKFSCKNNPFGTIYNPHSIHKAIRYSIVNKPITENTFVQRDDVFLNYDFHSAFSSMNLIHLQEQLKAAVAEIHSFLCGTQWIMITYGTAWVYERRDTKEVVANCHKMPQALFTKSLLTQKKIIDSFEDMYAALKSINPDIRILLTVSPVRHVKETLELNGVSKSVLRVACHTLAEQHPDVQYFPAYEIMMDDLRDYRFYKPDMIHPTSVAEEYIWQKFGEQYFDDKLKSFLLSWREIQSALAHKPFHPKSSSHQQFLSETLKKLEELKKIVNVDKEIDEIKKQMS